MSTEPMMSVPKQALDVLLAAAEWANKRMPIPENPINLALINMRAAMHRVDPACDPAERTVKISIAFAKADYELVKDAARHAGVPVAEFIRRSQPALTTLYDVDNPDVELRALLAQTGHRTIGPEVIAAIERIVDTYALGSLAPEMVRVVRGWLAGDEG